MRAVVLAALVSLFSLGVGRSLPVTGPPDVDLSLITETEGMEPKGALIVYISVSNKSDSTLSHLSVEVPSSLFKRGKVDLKSSLGPFGNTDAEAQVHIEVQSPAEIPFGKYQIPLALSYHWKSNSGTPPAEGDSVRRAPVTMEVRAPYSAVASGLPGGTGPLFWLLLPVIPAFLAFQFVQRLRHKHGPQVPTFSAESILPAFFIAIAVNSLPFWSSTLAKLSTLELLAGSALLGALWPACLWLCDKWRWYRWGLREDDKPEPYFRKVLLSHWVPRPLVWATGTVEESPKEGFLLHQPDGSEALGTDLQVTVTRRYKNAWPRLQKLFDVPALIKQADRGGFWSRRKLVFSRRLGWIRVASLPTEELQVREQSVEIGQEVAGFKKKTLSRRKTFLQRTT